jgi:hypothetical protein
MRSFRTLLKMLVQYVKSDRSQELREAVQGLADLEMARRKRTAVRLWTIREQLRFSNTCLEAYDYGEPKRHYLEDVRERDDAIRRTRT